MVLLLWDMVSQSKRTVWDISSQENQDAGPITNASSRSMLVTEDRRSSIMKQDVCETRAVSLLELLQRASTQSDLEAWAAFQQGLEETVLTWLYDHPGREAACHMYSERHFVALAFEQLRQAILQRQVACETLSGVLVYLRASLSGAILETARVSSRPNAVCEHVEAKQGLQEKLQSLEIWNWVQATLSSERERQLAYLLYHCGLSPEEIVRYCPQEWSDVCEVARLRCIILKQLTKELIQVLARSSGSSPVAP
jgi:hypothetical protein